VVNGERGEVPVQPIDDSDDGFEEVLRSLAASARRANLARTTVLEDALRALDAGSLAPDAREAAAQAAHQVVGSAGTFGRHRSSELAAGLEQWFRVGAAHPGEGLEQVRDQVAALRADLDRPDEAHRDEG
jgi:HPt (histidine-containing phosphotransfer) domain-containing protein